MLPRAPAKLSRQIDIGDTIKSIDGFAARPQDALARLQGNDEVGSQFVLEIEKEAGDIGTVGLKRLDTESIFDIRMSKFSTIFSVCLWRRQPTRQ
jgi:hypothetical protein